MQVFPPLRPCVADPKAMAVWVDTGSLLTWKMSRQHDLLHYTSNQDKH